MSTNFLKNREPESFPIRPNILKTPPSPLATTIPPIILVLIAVAMFD